MAKTRFEGEIKVAGREAPYRVRVGDAAVLCTGGGVLVAGYVDRLYEDGSPRVLPCDVAWEQRVGSSLNFVPCTTVEDVEKLDPLQWTLFPPRS